MPERPDEQFESPDSSLPGDEELDIELEPELIGESEDDEFDIEFGPESPNKNKTTEKGADDNKREVDETRVDLDKEYSTQNKKFKLNHPELDTSSKIPDPGKSFWEAPIDTLKGMWHRTLSPFTWKKRTNEGDAYTSWAKNYEAYKKAREETMEERGWAEDPVGAKWYSLPVGIAKLTTPIRGLWYAITSPKYIVEHDLSPNKFTYEDTEEATIYNLDRNNYRSLRHPIQALKNEIAYYKRLAEHVEWKEIKDSNFGLKSSFEKLAKESAEAHAKKHAEEYKKGLEGVEKYNAKFIEKRESLATDILDRVESALSAKGYHSTSEERANAYSLSDKLLEHAVNRLTPETKANQEIMLDTMASTLSDRILKKAKQKETEPPREMGEPIETDEKPEIRQEIINRVTDAANKVLSAITAMKFMDARANFYKSINKEDMGINSAEYAKITTLDMVNSAILRIKKFENAPKGKHYEAIGIVIEPPETEPEEKPPEETTKNSGTTTESKKETSELDLDLIYDKAKRLREIYSSLMRIDLLPQEEQDKINTELNAILEWFRNLKMNEKTRLNIAEYIHIKDKENTDLDTFFWREIVNRFGKDEESVDSSPDKTSKIEPKEPPEEVIKEATEPTIETEIPEPTFKVGDKVISLWIGKEIKDGKLILKDGDIETVTSIEYNPTKKCWEIYSKDNRENQMGPFDETSFVHLEKVPTIETKALELPFKIGDRVIAKEQDGKKGQIKRILYMISGNFYADIDFDDGSNALLLLENLSPE